MIKTGSATILSSAARLQGDMVADEEIILAGSFEGTLRTSRSLQVTNSGSFQGEIHADYVVVLGRVDGPIPRAAASSSAGRGVTGDLGRHTSHPDEVFSRPLPLSAARRRAGNTWCPR